LGKLLAMTQLDTHVTHFETYEARENAFRRHVYNLVPRKHGSPRLFWQDYARIDYRRIAHLAGHPMAWISSNPRDCLAFGSAQQVLNAAGMSLGRYFNARSIAEKFDLLDLRHQPLRTLSGGETVKLALAKAYIAADTCQRFYVASPFVWLAPANHHLFNTVLQRFADKQADIGIFVLTGETCPDAALPSTHAQAAIANGPNFQITTRRLSIALDAAISQLGNPPAMARVSDTTLSLISPCLIRGANGAGKSLLAKTLAGVAKHTGTATLLSGANTHRPRMLFQDVIAQLMLRPIHRLLNPDSQNLFENISDHVHRFINDGKPSSDATPLAGSLLATKCALAAARIAERPRALILDEPDWGLSRPAAIAFVFAVIQAAHDYDVPLLIISHKSWWRHCVNSRLFIDKHRLPRNDRSSAANILFTITISAQSCAGHMVS